MEYIGLGILALAFLGLAYTTTHLMTGVSRNEGSTHGGGSSEASVF